MMILRRPCPIPHDSEGVIAWVQERLAEMDSVDWGNQKDKYAQSKWAIESHFQLTVLMDNAEAKAALTAEARKAVHDFCHRLLEEVFKIDPATMGSGNSIIDELADAIPAVRANVKHPIENEQQTLAKVIISLNDSYDWTREQIADWLDTLDLDLKFPTPEVQK